MPCTLPIRSKLRPSEVLLIRRWREIGAPITQLARHFDMSKNAIADIVHRRTWKNLEEQHDNSAEAEAIQG